MWHAHTRTHTRTHTHTLLVYSSLHAGLYAMWAERRERAVAACADIHAAALAAVGSPGPSLHHLHLLSAALALKGALLLFFLFPSVSFPLVSFLFLFLFSAILALKGAALLCSSLPNALSSANSSPFCHTLFSTLPFSYCPALLCSALLCSALF